jgi:hypothetical protein
MRIRLLASAVLAVLAVATGTASAAPPAGFQPPRTVAAGLQVERVAAAPSAIAYLDGSGDVWATRVRADGTLGSPLPAAQGQRFARDLQVVVTDRGELVVLWTVAGRTHGAIRYAVAPAGRSFSGARTLANVVSSTGAAPRVAALRGGTVAVVYRDRSRPTVLRFARRPPGGTFGPARSLGHDGVAPEIEPSPGGGALLAWARGPLGRRNLEVASAQRGALLPGAASSVAGRVRSFTLTASGGETWVTWTRREGTTLGFARQTRAGNRAAVGPVASLGTVAYGVPRVALEGDAALIAWNAQGPGLLPGPNVGLASIEGRGGVLGPQRPFDAGGFSQTTPAPALAGGVPVIVYTRQLPEGGGVRNEVAAADPSTGDSIVLGAPRTIEAPAVAVQGTRLLVAWPAATGGVAVTVR